MCWVMSVYIYGKDSMREREVGSGGGREGGKRVGRKEGGREGGRQAVGGSMQGAAAIGLGQELECE